MVFPIRHETARNGQELKRPPLCNCAGHGIMGVGEFYGLGSVGGYGSGMGDSSLLVR